MNTVLDMSFIVRIAKNVVRAGFEPSYSILEINDLLGLQKIQIYQSYSIAHLSSK